jgi:hypothetical protein
MSVLTLLSLARNLDGDTSLVALRNFLGLPLLKRENSVFIGHSPSYLFLLWFLCQYGGVKGCASGIPPPWTISYLTSEPLLSFADSEPVALLGTK